MQSHLLWPRPGQTRRQSVFEIRDGRRTSHRQAAIADYLAAASALLRRALRRFAAFLWMIPRLAALSIADISRRICSVLAGCAERAPFCIVRKPVTTLRLRSVRFALWRARLAADLVLAIGNQKVLWNGTLVTQLRLSTAKSCLAGTGRRISGSFCLLGAARRPGPWLQALVQRKLRFLSLGSKPSSHSHLFGGHSAGGLCGFGVIRCALHLWLILRQMFRWRG